VLGGFSQGCAMALHTALRHPARLAGVLALSGYLPLAPLLAGEQHAANAQTPVFMAHGTQDTVVPIAFAELSRQTLLALGHPVEWHAYPMPHSTHPQELADIGAFLRRVLGSSAAT
jgi:phospholipase/carboxylesterase